VIQRPMCWAPGPHGWVTTWFCSRCDMRAPLERVLEGARAWYSNHFAGRHGRFCCMLELYSGVLGGWKQTPDHRHGDSPRGGCGDGLLRDLIALRAGCADLRWITPVGPAPAASPWAIPPVLMVSTGCGMLCPSRAWPDSVDCGWMVVEPLDQLDSPSRTDSASWLSCAVSICFPAGRRCLLGGKLSPHRFRGGLRAGPWCW